MDHGWFDHNGWWFFDSDLPLYEFIKFDQKYNMLSDNDYSQYIACFLNLKKSEHTEGLRKHYIRAMVLNLIYWHYHNKIINEENLFSALNPKYLEALNTL